MANHDSFTRSRSAVSIFSLVTALALILPLSARAQQPLPITRLAYSVKLLCGSTTNGDASLPAGSENTVIEVHNPHTILVTVTIKVIEDYPTNQIVVQPYNVILPANGALNLDCVTLLSGFSCPPLCSNAFRGFVEISCAQQIKVVALYKETMAFPGLVRSASIAKKSSPAFIFNGQIHNSATFMVGSTATASQDTVRRLTTVSIANMGISPVSANISIVSKAGVATSFLRVLLPNGFTTVTEADLPISVPRPFVGGVTVQYSDVGFGPLLECEEIIEDMLISGPAGAAMSMSVVEVQPIPIRQ